jgi:DUF4097 and DUF4098 domain-containing protein YvlB
MASDEVVLSVPGPAALHLSTSSGRVTVTAEDRSDVLIESGSPPADRIERDATGRIRFASPKGGSANLELRCPLGSDIVVGTISGAVTLRGQLGAVRATTVSGNVSVESAEELDVRSISGSIDVERASARCRLQTKSGHAVCNTAADAQVSTLSGRIRLSATTGKVHAQSVSGAVDVGTAAKGEVTVQTISGSVHVAVPQGVRPSTRLRSISGRPRVDCPPGEDCEIRVQSMSGKIEVVPD